MSWIRLAPATAESLLICVAIFFSCLLQSALFHERFEVVQRDWGAIRSFEMIDRHDGVREATEIELVGPFDVWRGDWWRIPVTAFHHANLFHLALSLIVGWYLGQLLERCWGSLDFMLFLIPATCLPVLAELCWGQAYQGLSGTLCAMLGALIVLRRQSNRTAKEFPEYIADLGLVTIVVCWLLNTAGIATFPNAAHFTGFIYGALIAGAMTADSRMPVSLRTAIVLAHLGILPAMVCATRPTWIGRYHWFHATTLLDPQASERSYERAIRCDPALVGAWLQWSHAAELRDSRLLAWERLVSGLVVNPSSARLMDDARRIWRHLDVNQRHEADAVLVRNFGNKSALWRNQIRTDNSLRVSGSDEDARNGRQELELENFELDQRLDLPSMKVFPAESNRPPASDSPEQFDAVEGERL